jgi:hypothetical protein
VSDSDPNALTMVYRISWQSDSSVTDSPCFFPASNGMIREPPYCRQLSFSSDYRVDLTFDLRKPKLSSISGVNSVALLAFEIQTRADRNQSNLFIRSIIASR